MSANPIKAVYDHANQVLQAGDADEAELICRRALPHIGRDANIICLMGEICLRQRRLQEAKSLYGEVLGKHEGFPRALEGLGLALLADKEAAEASKYLSRAVAAVPRRSKST